MHHRAVLCLAALFTLPGPRPAPADGVSVDTPRTFAVGGDSRPYYLHLPPDLPPGAPLVVALHGLGGSAARMRYGLGLNDRASRAGMAVVYPQGLPSIHDATHWNANLDFSDTDDIGYLTALIADLRHRHDLGPVAIMGISNGGYMAYALACAPGAAPVHAIAVVAGTMSAADWDTCAADLPVSVLHIHGEDDDLIPFDAPRERGGGWGGAPPVPHVVAWWARANGATETTAPTPPGTVAATYWRNPATGAEVELMRVREYGHDWPNLSNASFEAADEVIGFFARVLATAPEE